MSIFRKGVLTNQEVEDREFQRLMLMEDEAEAGDFNDPFADPEEKGVPEIKSLSEEFQTATVPELPGFKNSPELIGLEAGRNLNKKTAQNQGLMFVLSRRIIGRAFTGAIIYGEQRMGKSSYALQVMYDIYKDWDIVFYHVFYDLDELMRFIKHSLTHDQVVPVILWDDAGVHGGAQEWYLQRRKVQKLQQLFDLIGSKIKGVLITTPNPQNLIKSIRSYEFYRIGLSRMNAVQRRATGYKLLMLPSGTRNIRKEFYDEYNMLLPNPIYYRYKKLRDSYLVQVVNETDDEGESIIATGINGQTGMSMKKQVADTRMEDYLV